MFRPIVTIVLLLAGMAPAGAAADEAITVQVSDSFGGVAVETVQPTTDGAAPRFCPAAMSGIGGPSDRLGAFDTVRTVESTADQPAVRSVPVAEVGGLLDTSVERKTLDSLLSSYDKAQQEISSKTSIR